MQGRPKFIGDVSCLDLKQLNQNWDNSIVIQEPELSLSAIMMFSFSSTLDFFPASFYIVSETRSIRLLTLLLRYLCILLGCRYISKPWSHGSYVCRVLEKTSSLTRDHISVSKLLVSSWFHYFCWKWIALPWFMNALWENIVNEGTCFCMRFCW